MLFAGDRTAVSPLRQDENGASPLSILYDDLAATAIRKAAFAPTFRLPAEGTSAIMGNNVWAPPLRPPAGTSGRVRMPSLSSATAARPIPPSNTPGVVFAARGLTKVYHMGEIDVQALRGIDLELYEGEFVVLLGPSGSGKSTLLNILGGLDVPSGGSVFYRGQELTRFDDAALTRYRRENVGFVFQFYNLIPSLTARENVALVTDIASHPMKPSDALALVNLTERMDHFPSQLSGGEQQRVAIARAVAKRPAVLLCDEPTGALDVHTGVLVLEAISRINRELGTTTAVITHNAVIAEMADRVISISDGRIVHVELNPHKRAPGELKW